MTEPAGREIWGSRLGFLMAAVGLGNIWRFTYIMGENGGAAFIFVYLACIAAIGAPVFLAELCIGRSSRRNPVGAFRRLGGRPDWVAVGVMGVGAGFLVLSFYSVVAGWVVYYIFASLTGTVGGLVGPDAAAALFAGLTGSPAWSIGLHAVFMLMTTLVVAGGVRGGLERTGKLLMPLLLIILAILIVRGLTLPGSGGGVSFLVSQQWGALSPRALLTAMGHAFFTLSVGMGAMITYGSYLPDQTDMPRATGQVAALDTVIAIAAGFAIFPALFAFSMEPGQGPGLIFVTLPAVFASMTAGGFFAFLFFVLVLLAAITSSISMLEVVTAYVVDEHGWSRRRAASWIGGTIFLAGVPAALASGPLAGWSLSSLWLGHAGVSGIAILDMNWFDLVAHVVSDYMLPVGGLCMAVFVGWWWRLDEVLASVRLGSRGFRALGLWLAMLRWVVPVVVAEVLLLGILAEFDPVQFPRSAALTAGLQPWLVALVAIIGLAALVAGARPAPRGGSGATDGA